MSEILWPEFSEKPPKELGVKRRDVWQRMQAGLYLMATTGISVVQELMVVLSERYGVQPNADSLHRIFRHYLCKAGLIHYQVLPHLTKNGLALVRLTEMGKAVCSGCGWAIVISDWEKLIDLHSGQEQLRHTAMVLDFAWQARIRGYYVFVMPTVQFRYTVPDVYVERDEVDKAFVEIERGLNKAEKWFNLNLLQGFVAVCVTTAEKRVNILKRDIRPLGISYIATDLQSLKNNHNTLSDRQLWLEFW